MDLVVVTVIRPFAGFGMSRLLADITKEKPSTFCRDHPKFYFPLVGSSRCFFGSS
jgi:hypothetical protein